MRHFVLTIMSVVIVLFQESQTFNLIHKREIARDPVIFPWSTYRPIWASVIENGVSNETNIIKTTPTSIATLLTSTKTTPASIKTTPASIKTTPTSIKTTPTSIKTTPTSIKTTPTSIKTTPTSIKTTPTSIKTTPTSIKTTPTSIKTTPTSIKTTPTSIKTTPASIKTTPASIKTTPASIKTTPTSIKTTPTSIKTTPTSIKTTPTSIKTTPTSIKTTPTSIKTTPTSIKTTPTPNISTSTPIKTGPTSNSGKPKPNVPIWDTDTDIPNWDLFQTGSGFVAPEHNNTFNELNPGQISCNLTSSPPSPRSMCCGVDALSNDRIIGGNTTQIEQHPWLVQIEYHDKNNNEWKRLCGGFLISARYVLSAAHCFAGQITRQNTAVNVILGEYNTTNEGRDCVQNRNGTIRCTDGAIRVPIEKYRTHPKYLFDNARNLNDIAIIRLHRTVEFTKYIRPICLPTSDVTVAPAPNLRFTTAGWGAIKHMLITDSNGARRSQTWYDDMKRHVDLPFLKTDKCREQFSFLTPGHLCAGGERGKDSCKGDSGGPLMHQKDGIFEAVGIVSTASGKYPCGTENRMAVYTNVYRYVGWITEHITP